MIIKVTREQAVAALLRGEWVFCAQTGEGWQICDPGGLPHRHFSSKNAVRRLLAHHAHDARAETGVKVVEWVVHR